MSREVRRVPKDWEHPRNSDGRYQPLFDEDYETAAKEWLTNCLLWNNGEHPDQHAEWAKGVDGASEHQYYWDWAGNPPDKPFYRPAWQPEERTHLQMYETCTEGTPISPVMETPEELAQWLADNNASAFADMTATYEQWLATIRRGWAPSAIVEDGKFSSGVAFTEKL